uniref:Uncharacterized protein n=1 Tax=Tanacetum cinerariifolium TaxID=118510 RepID=A0A699KMN3_TANCI|nr:hypothetical protein [Tanacetum cinerariifolium]
MKAFNPNIYDRGNEVLSLTSDLPIPTSKAFKTHLVITLTQSHYPHNPRNGQAGNLPFFKKGLKAWILSGTKNKAEWRAWIKHLVFPHRTSTTRTKAYPFSCLNTISSRQSKEK